MLEIERDSFSDFKQQVIERTEDLKETITAQNFVFLVPPQANEIACAALFASTLMAQSIPFLVVFGSMPLSPPPTSRSLDGLIVLFGDVPANWPSVISPQPGQLVLALGSSSAHHESCLVDFSQRRNNKKKGSEPHLVAFDATELGYGATQISLAAHTWLVLEALFGQTPTLPQLALVSMYAQGAFDRMVRSFSALNRELVERLTNDGLIQRQPAGFAVFGAETRPIAMALRDSLDPFIPGITGNEQEAIHLLVNAGIPLHQGEHERTIADLTPSELTKLTSELVLYMLNVHNVSPEESERLVAPVFTLQNEDVSLPTRDSREFAALIDAAARTGMPSCALSVAMGDRGFQLTKVATAYTAYRNQLSDAIQFMMKQRPSTTDVKSSMFYFAQTRIPPYLVEPCLRIAFAAHRVPRETVLCIHSQYEGSDNVAYAGIATADEYDTAIMSAMDVVNAAATSVEDMQYVSLSRGYVLCKMPAAQFMPFLKTIDKLFFAQRMDWYKQHGLVHETDISDPDSTESSEDEENDNDDIKSSSNAGTDPNTEEDGES